MSFTAWVNFKGNLITKCIQLFRPSCGVKNSEDLIIRKICLNLTHVNLYNENYSCGVFPFPSKDFTVKYIGPCCSYRKIGDLG